jgi:LacI family transcriptional regulator
VNIKQLANTLNLSTSTISRAFNGYTDVNPDTRLRVQQAAQSLGYRPDASARRLVRADAEAVGIVDNAAAEVL